MDGKFDETFYIFDFIEELRILRENPNFTLSYEQYEELMFFLISVMELELSNSLGKISAWAQNPNDIPANFQIMQNASLIAIRDALFEVSILLWVRFKSKGMFDAINIGDSTFPFVLRDIVGSNLFLMKDNIISAIEINPYG